MSASVSSARSSRSASPAADSIATFASLGIAPSLLQALVEEGYTTPTPIQAQAIPALVSGRDLLGCAQTGTGKTAAFTLPILHRLMEAGAASSAPAPTETARTSQQDARRDGRRGASRPAGNARSPRALILAPTRELAAQIAEAIGAYGRHTGITQAVVFGGVSQVPQVRALQRGVDILVATPGRLMDLMEQGVVDLTKVSIFVLDEADRMLDMGFIQPVRRIAAALPKSQSGVRQTMLFSATMPKEVSALAESLLRDPVRVAVARVSMAAAGIEQSVYKVDRQRKLGLLAHLIETHDIDRAIVFARTKRGADRLGKRLVASGITAESIHGDKSQGQRERALAAFRGGRVRVLVATDVAARGIDVDGISHVFNYDLPAEPEAYVHRIGRTARAGAAGVAIAFCDGDERDQLRDIEKLIGHSLTVTPLPTGLRIDPLPVGGGASADRSSERSGERSGSGRESRERSGSAGGSSRGRGRSSGGSTSRGAPAPRSESSSGASHDPRPGAASHASGSRRSSGPGSGATARPVRTINDWARTTSRGAAGRSGR